MGLAVSTYWPCILCKQHKNTEYITRILYTFYTLYTVPVIKYWSHIIRTHKFVNIVECHHNPAEYSGHPRSGFPMYYFSDPHQFTHRNTPDFYSSGVDTQRVVGSGSAYLVSVFTEKSDYESYWVINQAYSSFSIWLESVYPLFFHGCD